jgi:hypothetical protein
MSPALLSQDVEYAQLLGWPAVPQVLLLSWS